MFKRNSEKIATAKEALNKRGELRYSEKATKRTEKKQMLKVLVWSVALYASETWTLSLRNDMGWEHWRCGSGDRWKRSVGQNTQRMNNLRTTVVDRHNSGKTKGLDQSYTPRQFTPKNSSGRENGRQ